MNERRIEPPSAPIPTLPRPYDPPAVIYEATLEVRAGSPVDLNIDPLKWTDGP